MGFCKTGLASLFSSFQNIYIFILFFTIFFLTIVWGRSIVALVLSSLLLLLPVLIWLVISLNKMQFFCPYLSDTVGVFSLNTGLGLIHPVMCDLCIFFPVRFEDKAFCFHDSKSWCSPWLCLWFAPIGKDGFNHVVAIFYLCDFRLQNSVSMVEVRRTKWWSKEVASLRSNGNLLDGVVWGEIIEAHSEWVRVEGELKRSMWWGSW